MARASTNWDLGRVPAAGDDVVIPAGFVTITFSSGTTTVTSITSSTPLSITGGTLNIDGPASTINNLNLSSGTLGGSGLVTLTGTSNWSLGSMDGAGTTRVAAGATLSITGTGRNLYRTVENFGTINWSGPAQIFQVQNGSILNRSGGLFSINNNDTFYVSSYPGTNSIVNEGTLIKNGTGTLYFYSSNGGTNSFTNASDGLIQIDGGTFLASWNGTNDGVIEVLSGELWLGANFTHTVDSTLTGSGTLRVTGGTHNFPAGTVSVTGTGWFSGGSASFNDPVAFNGSVVIDGGRCDQNVNVSWAGVNLTGGTLGGSGLITLTGTSSWSLGSMDGAGTTRVAAGATLSITGTGRNLSRTVENFGTINWSGPAQIFQVLSGSILNRPGALFSINNNEIFYVSSYPGTNSIVNEGTLIKNGTGTLNFYPSNGGTNSFTNASDGLIQINGGYFQMDWPIITQSNSEINVGSSAFFWRPSGLILSAGTLSGNGTVNGSVNNTGGIVEPGSSPGTLTITGNYTQGPSGTLHIEASGPTPGTQHDQLIVTGSASLDGTLEIELLGGYEITSPDLLIIISAASRSGTFSNVTPPCEATVDYRVASVTLLQAPAGPTATAANNGPVNVGQTLTLTGGPGGMASYSWSGPDGFTSSNQSPTVSSSATLAMSGTYTLIVTNAAGCSDSETTEVTVGAPPADADSDGVPDATDNCPTVANAGQQDGDSDGVGDACDSCPTVANAGQEDADSDDVGDACEGGTIALNTSTPACYNASNDQLIVDLDLTATQNIVAGQFYLEYDTAVLDLFEASGITVGQAPFTSLLLADVDDPNGLVDLAVGVPTGNPGASSGRMMRLTFDIVGDTCGSVADLVAFRAHAPPTRITDIDANPYDVDNGDLVASNLAAISTDIHVPTISDPGDLNLECGPGNAAAITAWLASAVAADGCGVTSFSNDYTGLSDLCGNTGTATVTWTAQDACGNTTTRTRAVTVVDTTPPSFSNAPPNMTLQCADPGIAVAINAWLLSAAATDACGSAAVTHNYTGLTPGTCAGTGSATVTWTATDLCGLFVQHAATVQVIDNTPPAFPAASGGILPPIATIADAGVCTATVVVPTPTVVEACDASYTLTGVRGDAQALNAAYPSGPTTITWTATDCSGNTTVVTQAINVAAVNEIDVDLSIGGLTASSVVRCIRFEVFPAGCGSPVVVEQDVTFSSGSGSTVVQVPCGPYVCITARDPKHSLRRTDADDFGTSPIVGLRYRSYFTNRTGTGGHNDTLQQGNLYQDGNEYRYIDILDFATLLSRFGTAQAVDTACGFVGRHADLTGDGTVSIDDLAQILSNFGRTQEANCCGLSTVEQPERPQSWATAVKIGDEAGDDVPADVRLSISVAELLALGLDDLIAADRNGDGVVDLTDADHLGQEQPADEEVRPAVPQPNGRRR